jgi:hypothetical protein
MKIRKLGLAAAAAVALANTPLLAAALVVANVSRSQYAAEVPIELIEDDTAWSPYLSPQDVGKLETVRLALKRGDTAEATKYGRVSELTPVAAK